MVQNPYHFQVKWRNARTLRDQFHQHYLAVCGSQKHNCLLPVNWTNLTCQRSFFKEVISFFTETLTIKICIAFFLNWNEWKNSQFNFSTQDLSIELNFFKWDGNVTKILHLLFHRIWKKTFNVDFYFSGEDPDFALFKPPSDFPLNLIGKLMNFCLI